jgi:hypothetical protein
VDQIASGPPCAALVRDVCARDRHDAVGDGLIEPLLHALARIEALGDDDNLGEV